MMIRRHTLLLLLAALLVAAHAAPVTARPRTPATFDHSKFNALLMTAVANGRVDYTKFKGNADFAAYLTSLGTASVGGFSNDELLAFWLNAYNAMVIKNVLDHPGIQKPTDVKGFFDQIKFRVAGQSLTLNDIENTKVRTHFNDPLVHFGMVCAALNCPPLLARAYQASSVHAQLGSNARAYLASRYNRYDAHSNTMILSKIFDWYSADFGGIPGIRTFLRTYGTPTMQTVAAKTGLTFSYPDYDWTLNAK